MIAAPEHEPGWKTNLELCRINSGFELYREDAVSLFRRLRGRPVDFVFLDPPYDFRDYDRLLEAVHGALAEIVSRDTSSCSKFPVGPAMKWTAGSL